MEWKPNFSVKKSNEDFEKRTIGSLVVPLRKLQAEIAQRGPYDKQEEIYAKKGSSLLVRYFATAEGFKLEILSSEPQPSQTRSINNLPAEEFVNYLTLDDAREIARKYNISLG